MGFVIFSISVYLCILIFLVSEARTCVFFTIISHEKDDKYHLRCLRSDDEN